MVFRVDLTYSRKIFPIFVVRCYTMRLCFLLFLLPIEKRCLASKFSISNIGSFSNYREKTVIIATESEMMSDERRSIAPVRSSTDPATTSTSNSSSSSSTYSIWSSSDEISTTEKSINITGVISTYSDTTDMLNRALRKRYPDSWPDDKGSSPYGSLSMSSDRSLNTTERHAPLLKKKGMKLYPPDYSEPFGLVPRRLPKFLYYSIANRSSLTPLSSTSLSLSSSSTSEYPKTVAYSASSPEFQGEQGIQENHRLDHTDLYYHDCNPGVRAVRLCLEYLRLHVNLRQVKLYQNVGKKKDKIYKKFLKLNPFRILPMLDDEGFVVVDSQPIMSYLVQKYDEGGTYSSLYPTDNFTLRAIIDMKLHFLNNYIFPVGRNVVEKALTYGIQSVTVDDIDLVKRRLNRLNIMLTQSKYIAAEHITIADISFISLVATWGIMTKMPDFHGYQEIMRWMKLCESELISYSVIMDQAIAELKSQWPPEMVKKPIYKTIRKPTRSYIRY